MCIGCHYIFNIRFLELSSIVIGALRNHAAESQSKTPLVVAPNF